jgi:hypothetical protein
MGHDGEGDRPIDVVELAGSDIFAVNKLDGSRWPRACARISLDQTRD